MSPKPTPPETPAESELSYEEAREQLVEVVHQLESGNVPLSRSMELWERGERLAAVCQAWLDGARERIDAARAGSDLPPDSSVLD